MILRALALLSTVLVFFLLVASAANAQGLLLDDPELVTLSDVVVTGDVVGMSSARDPVTGYIYTYVAVRVGERLKGWVPEDEIIVKQLGGRDGDEVMVIPDQAEFTVGEEVLLFLVERPRDGTVYTTGFWQGKWAIDRDPTTGSATLRRSSLRASDLARFDDPDQLAAAAAYRDTRLLAPFLAQIRSWSGKLPIIAPAHVLDLTPSEAPPTRGIDREAPGVRPNWVLLGCSDNTDNNCQNGTPARWHEADNGTPVRVDVQAGGEPALAGGGFSEIAAARGLWNAVNSSLNLGSGNNNRAAGFSTTQVCNDTDVNDGRIAIYFRDPCDEIDNGTTVAVGGYFSNFSTVKQVKGVTYFKATRGFVINNDGGHAIGFLDESRCFQDVQTHELGHAIGLGHTPVPNSIMNANIDPACQTAAGNGAVTGAITGALSNDDKNAIMSIYPGSAAPPPPDGTGKPGRPRNLTYELTSDRVILDWDPPTTGGSVNSYQILGGSDSGRKNLANFDTFQNATKINLKIGTGEYYVRVNAKNGFGQSDQSSNEIHFTVTDLPRIPNPVFVEPTINVTVDSQGDVMVLGEIQNRVIGGISPTFIRIEANFMTPGGNSVGTRSVLLMGRSRRLRDTRMITHTALLPGQRGCFQMFTDIPASQVSQVALGGSFSTLSHDAVGGQLQISSYMGRSNDQGFLQMVGTAKNIGSVPSYLNRVNFDVKTPEVQACDFTFIDGNTVNAGGTMTDTGLSPGQVGPYTNDTTIAFQSIEVRRYTNWEAADTGNASSALQAAIKAEPAFAGEIAKIASDRTRLKALDHDPEASREEVHELRNAIEERLRALEERLAARDAERLPFAEPIVVPVRRGSGQ